MRYEMSLERERERERGREGGRERERVQLDMSRDEIRSIRSEQSEQAYPMHNSSLCLRMLRYACVC
jgi:hypothetical protein